LTTTGRIFGTPEYMSPEQAEGVEEPDARSDVYSLGVVVYEMVTGRVPFSGTTPLSIMRGHADKPPPSPSQFNPDVSPAVEAVLLKALAKKREERYQSAGEMAVALQRAVSRAVVEEAKAPPPVEAPPPEPVVMAKEEAKLPTAPPAPKAVPKKALALGGGLVMILIVAVYVGRGPVGALLAPPTATPTNTWTPTLVPTYTSTATFPPTSMPQATPAPEEIVGPTAPPVTDIMMEIPAGPLTMGSDTGKEDEAPAHKVDLPTFKIDRFEVTNADFAQFVEATGYQTDAEKAGLSRTWRDAAEGKDIYPVVYVSWNDAVAYCAWVGKRLPTEAEWEKAARGTDRRMYPWGDEWDPSKANVKETGLRGTAAIGSFAAGASPYGVEDMAGNVWEWTADWYEAYPGSSFQSPYYGGQYRVLRGGGWFETADFVRTTTRNAASDTAANDDLGFRCAR
jgi:serine/threonine-protein kinase